MQSTDIEEGFDMLMARIGIAAIIATALTAPMATVFAETPPPDELEGRFCVGSDNDASMDDCFDVEGMTIAVEAAEDARKWVWIEAEGAAVAIGAIAAGEKDVTLPDPKQAHLSFRLTGDNDRGWPAPANLSIRRDEERSHPAPHDGWAFTLPSARAGQPVHLYVPAGVWQLSADAPGHLLMERERLALAKETLNLGMLRLDPAPRIRLRLTDGTGAPVAGAVLRSPEGEETLSVSDPTGRMEWEPERGELPSEVVVEATGFASKSVDVRERRVDLVLDPLVLGRGGNLRLIVDRPASDDPIEVELIKNQRRRYSDGREGSVVASATLAPGERELTLTAIEEGRYSLHMDGEGPLEHWAEHVEITEGKTAEVDVTIEPFELEVKVTVDDQPLPRATIDIGTPTAPGPEWKGTLQANDDGVANGTAWQRSINVAFVRNENPKIQTVEFFKLDGSGDETIEIALRNMKIAGTVIDGETGEPMPSTPIGVRWKGTSSGGGTFSMRTDADGRFERSYLEPGSYALTISNPEYVALHRVVEISEEVPEQDVELILERGDLLHVQVVDEGGTPMGNAVVLELGREFGNAPHLWQAGIDGRATIPMGRDMRREVWFAAPAGTFGHAIFDESVNGSEASPHTLVMPHPAGTITIAAVDDAGTPLASVWLAVQHDKVPLPLRLVRLLERFRGISFRTGIDGTVTIPNMPTGLYEWWTWKIDSDHVAFEVPVHRPRPPEQAHFFSGGQERVTVVVPPQED